MHDECDPVVGPEDDDFEEIDEQVDPQEVDMVLTSLEQLIGKVQSQTIRDYLECTCIDLAYLVEEKDDDLLDEDEAAAA